MLENLEPKEVFRYFEEIAGIPHGSGNVAAISAYLMTFAAAHGLKAYQDEQLNVIMIREATEGMEDRPTVMLQGHMDMVAVKDEDCGIDLQKDGLQLLVEGDYLCAKGTSLGGDDGIAVAYGLALMAADDLMLPRLELVITTEEETGMEGASGIDLSVCRADRMLNIDSEKEGEFVAACAGGVRVNGRFPLVMQKCSGLTAAFIKLEGLLGGHSGTEIDRGGANANILMGRILTELSRTMRVEIGAIEGGSKDNAIAVEACADIYIESGKEELLQENCRAIEKRLRRLYAATDPGLRLCCSLRQTDCDLSKKAVCMALSCKQAVLSYLSEVENGVQSMSRELSGLVQTSLNLGTVRTGDAGLEIVHSLRSSVAEEKEALKEKICKKIRRHGGEAGTSGDYPAWEYRKDSPLREHMIAVYERRYAKSPRVLSIHAGLECGILAAKKPGLDCVSFGPDILDIHTTRERMSISSVKRVWEFLVEVLETGV